MDGARSETPGEGAARPILAQVPEQDPQIALYFVLAQEIAQHAIRLLEKLLTYGTQEMIVADKIRNSPCA
jgi:hypothetical protein